jgi:N-acetyl-anhydromuramyl-L-alanine amidase AmpD
LTEDEFERVRGGGWDLDLLRQHVDQFVLHYDVCGVSRQCFRVLHDMRGLSVQFMLDIDGTIYQTMDLKDKAWHATVANNRSVGVEIANIGAYGEGEKDPFAQWYATERVSDFPDPGESVRTRITIPARLGEGGVRTPFFVGYTARPEPVLGEIHGRPLRQYDLTEQQYRSLVKLTASLHRVLPRIDLDYPRDASGRLVATDLSKEELERFHGVLGHYHIQKGKVDPGPAMQWDRVVNGARTALGMPVLPPGADSARPGRGLSAEPGPFTEGTEGTQRAQRKTKAAPRRGRRVRRGRRGVARSRGERTRSPADLFTLRHLRLFAVRLMRSP